jgi:hypothetical protein
LAGQDGVSGIVGYSGLIWGGRERKGPDTFWTDGAPGKEVGVVKGMGTHGEEALLPGMEMEAADVAAGATGV